MRATIHQPYFLPWLGYFGKLAHSDAFVVLDNVLFRKRHFIDRTQHINSQGTVSWIGLPVGEQFGALCSDVCLAHNRDTVCATILRTLRESYAHARHIKQEWPALSTFIEESLRHDGHLVSIDTALIHAVISHLGLPQPAIHYSSRIVGTCADPTDRIIAICSRLGITTLVVGAGSSLKLHDWDKVRTHGIGVEVQDYLSRHPTYYQTRRQRDGFVKGLSVVDAILNVGRESTMRLITDPIHTPLALDKYRLVEERNAHEKL